MHELLKVLQLLGICVFHSSNWVTNPHRREEYTFSIFCTSIPTPGCLALCIAPSGYPVNADCQTSEQHLWWPGGGTLVFSAIREQTPE